MLVSPVGTPSFYQFPPRAPEFIQNRAQVGDSSGPCFAFYKGEQVLVGHTWVPGTGGTGTAVGISFYAGAGNRATIESTLAELDEGYSIQTISLDP